MKPLLLLSVFTGTSLAQAAAYAQCGGTGWTGETTCVSGWTCKVQNPYYSQCVQSDSADDVSSAAAAVTTAAAAAAQTTVVSKPFVSTPAQTEAKAASTSSKKIACGSKATTLRTRTRTIKTTTAAAATVKASSAAAVVSIKTTSIAPVVTLKTTTKAAQTTAAAAVTTAKAVVTTTKRATTSTITKAKTTSTTAKAAAATTAASSSDSSSGSGLKWVGVDESGAEFGTAYPGTYGVDFIFPDTTTIGTLISEGYNIFRVPFMMERMAVDSITATLDAAYLANLTTVVDYITSNGGWAALDPHNYGRYDGAVITSTSDFQTFWKNLATHFADNDNVIFDTNNEYHDMDQTLVLDLNQAAIDGIRAAGATSQYIFVEGNAYTGAWSWNTTNTNLAALTDTEDKIIYEMHQYLDSDSSGTSETCVSSTIGVERVEGATEWLRENGKLGIIGEFAGGANSVCMEAVTGMLDHLQTNSDVWMGAVWWAAGPWWGDYMYSFEPTSGTGYEYYDSLLKTYAP